MVLPKFDGPILKLLGDKMHENLVPDSDLMESIRAIGYSLETAIADLCDNSISANARHIDVSWDLGAEPFVTILDDGSGMTRDELRVAMKLAGKSPRHARSTGDLGRFGLGLKTASLSQARSLTVVSKKDGVTTCAQWDLDFLREQNSWSLRWLDSQEAASLPGASALESSESGTLVVWQSLDQLALAENLDENALAERFDSVANHLGLVFHRFLQSKPRSLRITVNGRDVPNYDPFLEGESGVVDRGVTYVDVNGESITVQPFILPSLSKMTRSQRDRAIFDSQKMNSAQGFYIYRNKRLISWGTWFRMAPKDASGKLARVRVDTGNSLDSQWKLGVMKSTLEPPSALKEALKRLVPQIIENSTRALRGRTNPVSHGSDGVWQVEELGSKAFALALNRSHPLLMNLFEGLPVQSQRGLENLLRLIESSIPASYLHQRLSQDNPLQEGLSDEGEIWEIASNLFELFSDAVDGDPAMIWDMVASTEPFRSDIHLKSKLKTLIKEKK